MFYCTLLWCVVKCMSPWVSGLLAKISVHGHANSVSSLMPRVVFYFQFSGFQFFIRYVRVFRFIANAVSFILNACTWENRKQQQQHNTPGYLESVSLAMTFCFRLFLNAVRCINTIGFNRKQQKQHNNLAIVNPCRRLWPFCFSFYFVCFFFCFRFFSWGMTHDRR